MGVDGQVGWDAVVKVGGMMRIWRHMPRWLLRCAGGWVQNAAVVW